MPPPGTDAQGDRYRGPGRAGRLTIANWLKLPAVKLLLAAGLWLMGLALAQAADKASAGGIGLNAEALMLAQVVILVLLGRLLGELMFRIGQPTIIGQILAGILLGPTVLGSLWPGADAFLFPKSPEQNAMINGISQLGILFLLLLAGMETDLGLA